MRTEQGLARTEHQSVFVDEHHIAVEPVLFGNIGKGIRACAAIAQNRQRVGFSTDSHDNVGFAAVGDGNGCAAAGGQIPVR